MAGLSNQNLTLPGVVSAQFAYETISFSDLLAPAQVHATVDGFIAGLDCEPATVTIVQPIGYQQQVHMARQMVSLHSRQLCLRRVPL